MSVSETLVQNGIDAGRRSGLGNIKDDAITRRIVTITALLLLSQKYGTRVNSIRKRRVAVMADGTYTRVSPLRAAARATV